MVRKNEYTLNKKVNESVLKKCGFRKEHGDCYTLKHFLYEKYVSLNILVMLDDLSLTVTVTDDKGNLYAPFYNPELVENNMVAQETIEEYNKVMDRLSKKKVTTKVKDMSNNKDDCLSIKIKYFTDKIDKVDFIGGKSDWVDLRAADTFKLHKGEFALIPLGVAMQLPKGYEAHVIPRSSTYKTWKIIQTNHMGLIDESYCGNNDQWFMPVIAMEDTKINVNDRICQFRIMKKMPKVHFDEVVFLSEKDRGGIGSTGRK